MSTEEQQCALSVEIAKARADQVVASCGAGLSALLGDAVTARSCAVDACEGPGLVASDAPVMHALCRSEGGAAPLHVVAGRAEAATLAGLQLGWESAQIRSAVGEELRGELRDAFKTVVAALLEAVCEALGDSAPTGVRVQDAREIPEPASDSSWIEPGCFVRFQLSLQWEDEPDARLQILLPASADASLEAAAQSLIFIEVRSDEFDRLEVIGNALTCDLCVEPPQAFLESLDSELDGAVVIVPWEIGGRSGLELVEMLSRDERMVGLRIAMSSEAPTRGMVAAAMRAGAETFLHRPYLREEVEDRLLRLAGDQTRAGTETDGRGPHAVESGV